MKKTITFLLLFILSFNIAIHSYAYNESKTSSKNYQIAPADISINAKSAVLMEAETGTVLYSQNDSYAESPASVTKIMTLLLVMEAIENGSLSTNDSVSISSRASSMGGSQVYLKEGERMTVEELIKCTVIASANDAAVALAETICGSEDAFVKAMNQKAEALGMTATHFENATGLDDETKNHVTSALDIAKMSRELLKYELITKYSSLWQDSIRNGEFILTNTNRLVRFYDGCNGLKTGFTDKAGFCISATAKRGNMQLIAVIMGAESRDIRNEGARQLLDFGFSNYALYDQGENAIGNIPVRGGTVDEITVYSKPFHSVINKSDIKSVSLVYEIPDYISAPISKNEAIGKIRFEISGKKIGECELFIKTDIDKLNLPEIFKRIVRTTLTGAAT